jgi:pyridinium-3,5-biscarboxylic acid mononucleotide synthase
MVRPMDSARLEALLVRLAAGQTTVDEARRLIEAAQATTAAGSAASVIDLGVAQLDVDRAERQGMPEVIFGEPKSAEQIVPIVRGLLAARQNVLVTRVSAAKASEIREVLPELVHNEDARTLSLCLAPPRPQRGHVVVVTAGTSDSSVAEEACETLRMAGITSTRISDVGVAGIHRLFARLDVILAADVVIAVAGMEGALPSVLGGLVRAPVIAVPTSVGYGANLAGFSALFSMLTTCASGVVVVNIDNGFGAAMAAHRILQAAAQTNAQS